MAEYILPGIGPIEEPTVEYVLPGVGPVSSLPGGGETPTFKPYWAQNATRIAI